ncbi:Putative LOC100902024, partial [Caligus rogercresseyi]
KDLFVCVDETTDRCGRSMTCIFCSLFDRKFLDRPYLVDMIDINTADNTNLQQAVTGGLFKFLGEDLDYSKIRLLLTDAAPYSLKAGRGLHNMFTNLIHVTCLCYGLNRVV